MKLMTAVYQTKGKSVSEASAGKRVIALWNFVPLETLQPPILFFI